MTEIVVDSADFDMYSVRPGAQELTFSLKELRAILVFCEVSGQPVSVYFSEPGQPILWTVNCFDALVVDFVLATLASAPDGSQMATPASQGYTPYQRGVSPPPNSGSGFSDGGSNRRGDDDDDDDDDDDNQIVEGTPERELKKARRVTQDPSSSDF